MHRFFLSSLTDTPSGNAAAETPKHRNTELKWSMISFESPPMVILCVLLFKFFIFRFFEQEDAEKRGREELRALVSATLIFVFLK